MAKPQHVVVWPSHDIARPSASQHDQTGALTTRTDTITAQYKKVELETGATVDVPVFVKEDDLIKVDTRTGAYVERISTKK